LEFVLAINYFSGFGWILFNLAVSLIEALDSSCSVDQLLFSGEKRVAGRA
jgi:hypothetical protein